MYNKIETYYNSDLAYIHDREFGEFARKSSKKIIETIGSRFKKGLVIDLGCGSGILSEILVKNNFDVMGIDLSQSMINIAVKRVPSGKFIAGSFYKEKIHNCIAVVSTGECLNYIFDGTINSSSLKSLFRKVHSALIKGGFFIFDLLEPGQLKDNKEKLFVENNEWAVLVEKDENKREKILTRRIITFRKRGNKYTRNEEIHKQKLFSSQLIISELRSLGFAVKKYKGYGDFILKKNHNVIFARKL
jgi:SAM-dependent methyltransferase